MEPINLNRLAYFATVIDAGSFTRAAERLGITKAVVSQQVARLEAELQTTLLVRTTRRLEPTEAGRLLHARCVMILRDVEEAVAEVGEGNTEVAGVLRVSASNDYGAIVLAPIAARFRQEFPACGVELFISDAIIDLIGSKMDLSIRVGWLEDSSLQARRIGTFRQILVASRDFAAKVTVDEPEDLASLPLVANSVLRKPFTWSFTRGDVERRTVTMRETLHQLDTGRAGSDARRRRTGGSAGLSDRRLSIAGSPRPYAARLGAALRRHSCGLPGRALSLAKGDAVRVDAHGTDPRMKAHAAERRS